MLAEVVTVNAVLAVPLAGVTIAGLKVQVMPETGEHENATLSLNPPAGVTVSMNWVDWPARTVAFAGVAPREKSALAMVMVTAADVLVANFPSPV
jgi:hypothetical protein